ncbi:alpha/beta hydrolase [Lentilactobacillus dabitei]|uniref:alpha/beta hydrolase n=1 Tax=Lentilactobacillus dabitei TaxID=2831523 RepID=UPI003221633E
MLGIIILTLIIILLVVGLVIAAHQFRLLGKPYMSPVSTNISTTLDSVPTLFLPGYFGNRYSFGFLLRRLVNRYQANKSMVIYVDGRGKLRVVGQLSKYRPLIQVIFQDKRSRPQQQSKWLLFICQRLADQYGVATINLVGHSMGCITIFWLLTHHQQELPVAISRVVTIAGPFNDSEIARNTRGVEEYPNDSAGPRKRTAIYRALAKRVSAMPKGIKFLNIAGTISSGQQNDGQVSLRSAFSLRYLLRDPIIYYRELVIRGKGATHRLLHENRVVDAHIAKFIWNT